MVKSAVLMVNISTRGGVRPFNGISEVWFLNPVAGIPGYIVTVIRPSIPMDEITTSSLYSEDLAPVPAAKRTWHTWNYAALWVCIACFACACGERVNVLGDRDFGQGDWLLVKWNGVHNTIQVIDDERVFVANSDVLSVNWQESHGGTTCDVHYACSRTEKRSCGRTIWMRPI